MVVDRAKRAGQTQLIRGRKPRMEMLGIVLGILGILVGIYFGVRSVFQSIDIEALQRAQRKHSNDV